MRYLGGKTRIASKIAEAISSDVKYFSHYTEPFCGTCSVGKSLLKKRGPFNSVFCDKSVELISMYCFVASGGILPTSISREEYAEARADDRAWFRGFVGFGCSFAGKFFGGYAAGEGRNYAAESARAIELDVSSLTRDGAVFLCDQYQNIRYQDYSVVYMDPPYRGTTEYAGAGRFDSDAFWEFTRDLSKRCIVFVSEYDAPSDATCVLEIKRSTNIRPKDGNEVRTEKLFQFK